MNYILRIRTYNIYSGQCISLVEVNSVSMLMNGVIEIGKTKITGLGIGVLKTSAVNQMHRTHHEKDCNC